MRNRQLATNLLRTLLTLSYPLTLSIPFLPIVSC